MTLDTQTIVIGSDVADANGLYFSTYCCELLLLLAPCLGNPFALAMM